MIQQLVSSQTFLKEDLTLTERSLRWTQNVTKLGILTGSGSPENAVEAEITQQYMDTAGVAGSILYIKRDADISGDRTRGWILV